MSFRSGTKSGIEGKIGKVMLKKMKIDGRSPLRKCLDRELDQLYLKGLTLDVGSKKPRYAHLCEKLVALDIHGFEGVNVLADAHNLPFKNNSFDNIIMISLLEHVQEPHRVIKEAWRVLKNNGTIVIHVPFMYPIHGDPNDYYRFTDEGLRYLLRDFYILKLTKTGGFFTLIARYIHFLLTVLKIKFLLPILNIFIFFDDKFPGIFKRTACGFFVVARKKS